MPDHIGAFLQASRCFAELGVNITRVSYNKAVDSHMLFIDVDGPAERLAEADERLDRIGYLPKDAAAPRVVLIEFRLRDVPGSVTGVLTLIEQYHFNISYISSQENGTGYQLFKMGLFVDDDERISAFLGQAEKLCLVRVIDYNQSEKVFDNSIFYRSFISGLAEMMQIGEDGRKELLVSANLAMQTLDQKGTAPYRIFDSIYCFTRLLAECRGGAFRPRVTDCGRFGDTQILLIEPNCGSNTILLRSGERALFIDCGYACYRPEMERLFRQLLPGYDAMEKTVLITHADLDHCGLLPVFDRVLASGRSAECLREEYEGRDGFREKNPLHRPYIRMCKVLTGYRPPEPGKVRAMWDCALPAGQLLGRAGEYAFGDLRFSVYEGQGGHLPGELVLIDEAHRLAFTGDIYVNIAGMTPEQRQYNQYAPILMTSVDTDPALCARERRAVLELLQGGGWTVFGAHGAPKEL